MEDTEINFSATANVGDKIKAYHFAPSPDREDSYLIGHVINKGRCESGYDAYTVQVVENVFGGKSVPVMEYEISFVPYFCWEDGFYVEHCGVERVTKVD
ncbi:MAG: hypothetical protein MK006_02020 [Pirellulales bacterium]|nr:hypothetical protein [Pirellulales bacterium]